MPVWRSPSTWLAVTSETSPLAKGADYMAAFFMDDYIGGRYSSSSAVGGAVLSLAFGPDVFAEILDGAAETDKLSLNENILENAALLDALIGVYERNVQGYSCTAVLPYSQGTHRFPALISSWTWSPTASPSTAAASRFITQPVR